MVNQPLVEVLIDSHIFFFFLKKTTPLLRNNLYSTKFTHFQCMIQGLLVNLQSYATITRIQFYNSFTTLKKIPVLIAVTPYSPLQPQATTDLFSNLWICLFWTFPINRISHILLKQHGEGINPFPHQHMTVEESDCRQNLELIRRHGVGESSTYQKIILRE